MMTDQLHIVDRNTCKGDGICVEICPEGVLAMVDGSPATVPDRKDACILCGQCVAVCPTESLHMPDLPDEDFGVLRRPAFGYEEFLDFLRTRRSVRTFKDRPVDLADVDRILQAAATAPMGMPPHSTEALVIRSRDELDFLLKELVKDYEAMVKAFSSPIGRIMVRLAAGKETYQVLKDYIIDIARHANEAYRLDGSDHYIRGAPMVLLFHGSRKAMSYEENAHLVCHHAMLAALSLGLGTTIIGLIPPVVDRSKLLRERYGIPDGNKVMTSLIVGHPKYRYRKGVRRDLAGVRTVEA
jgi:NAD-dependent dihydropyrimidine dehydrogenase PreA subunit/nitroreductase